MEHRALGKGLSALIPDRMSMAKDSQPIAQEHVIVVETSRVRDNAMQPRLQYDDAKLKELIASIKEKGMLQPILVREKEDGYEVIAGERRLRAARALNLEKVPVVVREATNQEALVLALVENIQREELNAIEEAKAFRQLVEGFGFSQDDLAQSLGKDRSTISNTLRLLKLPDDIQQAVAEDRISMGHARALLGAADADEMKSVFGAILGKGLSVREVENLIKAGRKTPESRRAKRDQRNTDVVFLEEDLQQVLGTRVRIQAQKKRGKIVIEFYSPDDLERIMRIIKSS